MHGLSTISNMTAALISASAIGIYGSGGDEVLTESFAPGSGFLADVCKDWEKEADLAEALGMRVVKVRTGVVLDRNGGALSKMLPAFKSFAGGRVGSGKQWMSWIHLQDLAGLFRFAVENPVKGGINATAPKPKTNAEFTTKLAAPPPRPPPPPLPSLSSQCV